MSLADLIFQDAIEQMQKGKHINTIADALYKKHSPREQLAEVINGLKRSVLFAREQKLHSVIFLSMVTAEEDREVEDATHLARILLLTDPNIPAAVMVMALLAPNNYPSLSAYQMGEVLLAPGVYPDTSQEDMERILLVAGYSETEVNAALDELYGTPIEPVTYREIQPLWRGSPQRDSFNNLDQIQQMNLPLTGILVRHGNIVDNLETQYGSSYTPLPAHGGTGGRTTEIHFDQDDRLVEVYGSYGAWFGGIYLLQINLVMSSGKEYKGFGNMQYANTINSFHYQASPGEQIVGFLGSTAWGNNRQSTFVGSIGVILARGGTR